MKTVELKVTGMKCEHCEQHMMDSLEKVPGVVKAIADHNHDRVLIRLSGDSVDEAAVKAAVESNEGKKFGGFVA